MRVLKEKAAVEIVGIGGPLMTAEGLQSLFPMSDLSIMGIVEIIPHIPKVLKRLRETFADIILKKPDVVVTIDSPGFCLRLARKLKPTNIPVVHYSLPTVWAWRPGRAKKCAEILTHALALLPFEPPYFEAEGLPTTFVGHPLIEEKIDSISSSIFRTKFNIPTKANLLCLLPGSRKFEVENLLPIFSETICRLQKTIPDLWVVMPTLEKYREQLESEALKWGLPVIVTTDKTLKYQAMRSSNFALAASGTVAVELALAQVPMVIAYTMNSLTHWIVKRLVKVKYACLVNLLLDRLIVPECLQEECTPEILTEKLREIFKNPNHQKDDLKKIKHLLQNNDQIPSIKAAEAILSVVNAKRDGKGDQSKFVARDKSVLRA